MVVARELDRCSYILGDRGKGTRISELIIRASSWQTFPLSCVGLVVDVFQYYNFTTFAMTLNEPVHSDLPPTDCRLRPDIRKMEDGDIGKKKRFNRS